MAISGFSGAMGIVTLSSRIFYDMGRGGVGVPWLVRIHQRFNTPTRLVLVICTVALVTGVLVGETTTPATTLSKPHRRGATALRAHPRLPPRPRWRRPAQLQHTGLEMGQEIRSPRWRPSSCPSASRWSSLNYAFYSSVIPVPAFPYNLAPYIVVVFALVGLTIYWRAHRRGVIDPLAGDDQLIANRELRPGYNTAV